MCGRFLYGWPSTPDYRPLTNDVADVDPTFQSALNALIRLPAEGADGHCEPKSALVRDQRVFDWLDATLAAAEEAGADFFVVQSTVTTARHAYESVWSRLPGRERAKYLYRIARILQERSREFAVVESLNSELETPWPRLLHSDSMNFERFTRPGRKSMRS